MIQKQKNLIFLMITAMAVPLQADIFNILGVVSLSGAKGKSAQPGQAAPSPSVLAPFAPIILSANTPAVGVGQNINQVSSQFTSTSPLITPILLTPQDFQYSYNTTPASVQAGVQYINVGLTDTNQQQFYVYVFDQPTMSAIWKYIGQQPGVNPILQIVCEIVPVGGAATNAPVSYAAIVSIVDDNGTVYATGSQLINTAVCYAEIAFNSMDSAVVDGQTSTAVVSMPILHGATALFTQGQPTTQSFGMKPHVLSGGNVWVSDDNFGPAPATITTYSPATPYYNYVAGNPASVQGGLQNINVGLTNKAQNGYYSFYFAPAVIAKIPTRVINAGGLYITVSVIYNNQTQQNSAIVALCDNKGAVYALGSQVVEYNIDYANIFFNGGHDGNTHDANGINNTAIQRVPVIQGYCAAYKQQAKNALTTPVQTLPEIA